MTSPEVVQLTREFLLTGLLLIGPAVATSLVVGLVISIFQTVTSIQEQTLTFAPRILAVALVVGLTISWSLQLMIDFTIRIFNRIGEVGV